jgi:tetratricopeptide (TPR) repeat protein
VQPSGGSRRVFEQFAWLQVGYGKVALSRPTHLRVTPAVERLIAGHMKQLCQMVGIVLLGILSACNVSDPLTPQPSASVSTNSPQTANDYLIRGDSFAATKDYSHAILDYDQAIRLNPEYAEAYNNRGYAYYWSGDAAQAITDYSRAIELRPNYAYAYNNRGAAYMASGYPSQAISDFDRALALQPEYPQAYINRGNAYLRLGHFGLAFADFRQGGAHPVRTIALLCGISTVMILLGAFIMNTVRQHAPAKSR